MIRRQTKLVRREEEVMGDNVIDIWDPEQFLSRSDLMDKLKKINSPDGSTNATIFRVPSQDHSYISASTPKYISIGPYHRGEPKLREMEAYKLHYLKELLEVSGFQFKDLVARMMRIENQARSCYSDPIEMKSDDFVEMMMLDGCFIILFVSKVQPGQTPPILSTRYKWINVLDDLFTLENQLPFFVLESIYEMVDDTVRSRDTLLEKLRNLLIYTLFSEATQVEQSHLLHFFHLALIGQHEHHPNTQLPQDLKRVRLYRTATELELSGVKFKTKDDKRLLHVRFHNGVIEMSPLDLNEKSNALLRNFIALEQCKRKYGMQFTSYTNFIDNLVHSNKDVELLVKREIFYNYMNSNEDVIIHYFSRLSNNIDVNHISNSHLRNTSGNGRVLRENLA